jgi:4-diphosphocytidyl-2-C-methyl-D-erythritol kinase
VIVFPNCKINLGLNITGKRQDGYHNLETVFFPVFLKDILEIIRAENSAESFHYSNSGLPVTGDIYSNLCFKAYQLLKKDFPDLPAIKLHLHKAIPTGAGLGGGSADAAFTLILLNNIYKLSLSTDQLTSYALQLGSDCPYFIINKPCFATGRGELLQTINLDLSAFKIVIVNPGIHISTATAFTTIKPAAPSKSIQEIINQPIETWKQELKNDFEEPVFIQHPEIKTLKETMYSHGAIYASMSGSGSTVYGIFSKKLNPSINLPSHNFIYNA